MFLSSFAQVRMWIQSRGWRLHTSGGKSQPKLAAVSKWPRQAAFCPAHSLRTPCNNMRQQSIWWGRQGRPLAGKGFDEAEVVALHAVVLAVRCPHLQETGDALLGMHGMIKANLLRLHLHSALCLDLSSLVIDPPEEADYSRLWSWHLRLHIGHSSLHSQTHLPSNAILALSQCLMQSCNPLSCSIAFGPLDKPRFCMCGACAGVLERTR